MTMMQSSSAKYEIMLVDRNSNFTLWQSIMMEVLTTQELDITLAKD